MADVFISYKSDRRAVVEHLSRVLELNGYSVWFDHALMAGEQFAPPIERELRAARVVLVLWCRLSVASDWVREEANLAKRLRTILPVRLERVDLPLGFGTLQAVDLSRWNGAPRSPVVDRLLREVARLVGRGPVRMEPELDGLERSWRGAGAPTAAQLATSRWAPEAEAQGIQAGSVLPGLPAGAGAFPERGHVTGPTQRASAGSPPPRAGHAREPVDDGGARGGGAWAAPAPAAARKTSLAATLADGASTLWRRFGRGAGVPAEPDPSRVLEEATAAPAASRATPSLPERPSLVVLPFANRNDDPEQDYFSDGITEEITAELSRMRWFFVIARNSAFTFKGKQVDVREVGRELGVRYALSGSVQKSGGRLRIGGQLVEAETGHHIWADRFDADLSQIFELQDRVTEAVVGALEPTLRNAEIERAQRKSPSDLDAYDLYLRALPEYHSMTAQGCEEAQALLRAALRLSPRYSQAMALFAACQVRRQAEGWARREDRTEATRFAREAARASPNDPIVLGQCALALAFLDSAHDEARALIERALKLCPNSALVEGAAGLVHMYGCRPDPAIVHLRHAMRLSPLDPWMSSFLMGIGFSHQIAGRLDEALEAGLAAIRASPHFGAPRRLVVGTLVMLGRMEEARQAARDLARECPDAYHVFAERVLATNPDKDYAKRVVEAYRAVGMPE